MVILYQPSGDKASTHAVMIPNKGAAVICLAVRPHSGTPMTAATTMAKTAVEPSQLQTIINRLEGIRNNIGSNLVKFPLNPSYHQSAPLGVRRS